MSDQDEGGKKKGRFSFKSLFVASAGGENSNDEDLSADSAVEADPAGTGEEFFTEAPTGGSAPSGAPTSLLDSDFATIYTKTNAVGDPSTDPLLEAFSGMSAMEEAPRRMAMGAMVKGMRADTASVKKTLATRIAIIRAALEQQEKRVRANADARAQAFASLKTRNEERIAALRAEIATLEGEIASTKAEADQSNLTDTSATAGFRERIQTEEARLMALQMFFK